MDELKINIIAGSLALLSAAGIIYGTNYISKTQINNSQVYKITYERQGVPIGAQKTIEKVFNGGRK